MYTLWVGNGLGACDSVLFVIPGSSSSKNKKSILVLPVALFLLLKTYSRTIRQKLHWYFQYHFLYSFDGFVMIIGWSIISHLWFIYCFVRQMDQPHRVVSSVLCYHTDLQQTQGGAHWLLISVCIVCSHYRWIVTKNKDH